MSLRTCFLVMAIAVPLCGCSSGSSTNATSGGPGGTLVTPGANEPVKLPNGETVPNVSCGDESVASAIGTWDVLASSGRAVDLTVDASSFVYTASDSTLSFTVVGAQMNLTWKKGTRPLALVAVTHTPTALDTGIVPLATGGQWTFDSNTAGGETCSAGLTANAFNATCSRFNTPLGYIGGTLVGTRLEEKSSIFGALGGKWHFTGVGGGELDATLSGNVVTAVVSGNAGIAGTSAWFTMKLCNGTGAGKSSSGLEVAATRR